MPEIFFPNYDQEYIGSNYPFADSATLTCKTLTLDPSCFVDAILYPIGSMGGGGLYLSSIVRDGPNATLWVGTPATPKLASATWPVLTPPAELRLADTFGQPGGLIVIQHLEIAQLWPAGTHVFTSDATSFVASCCIPVAVTGLQGFRLEDGTILSGDVWFVGADGVVLKDDDNDNIRVDIVGDPLTLRRECGPAARFTTPRFVKTINGWPPDIYGNWQIGVLTEHATHTAMRIEVETPDTLKISMAAKPAVTS